MYVAARELKADGKVYKPGDPVPAETWKTLRALLSLGWVKHLPGIEAMEPASHRALAPSLPRQEGEDPDGLEGQKADTHDGTSTDIDNVELQREPGVEHQGPDKVRNRRRQRSTAPE